MRRLAFATGLVVIALLLLVGGPAAAQADAAPVTYFVNDDAAGANDGTSWENAFTDLQSALAVAVAGDSIWVASGTYKPSLSIDGSTDARTASFSLKSGVALYGGFEGVENQLEKRSSDPALTVLSGDIGVAGDSADNSYHVVYVSGVTGAVFDGFTVTGGRGDRAMGAWNLRLRDTQGAGMYTFESVADRVQLRLQRQPRGREDALNRSHAAPACTTRTARPPSPTAASRPTMRAAPGLERVGPRAAACTTTAPTSY